LRLSIGSTDHGCPRVAQAPPPRSTENNCRRPIRKFGGVIKEKASESTAWWAPRVVPPKGVPNVLLIMTDDQGFGAPSTFGGVIPTPAMDRIAAQGLRYTIFIPPRSAHRRGALITGRNHHFGWLRRGREISTGFPGYDSIIPIEKGTIGTILKANRYATSWFGKDHNTPSFQSSQAGPFNQWPTGMGFEYFYGFVGGDCQPVATEPVFVTQRLSIPSRAIPAGTWRRPWPTRPSST